MISRSFINILFGVVIGYSFAYLSLFQWNSRPKSYTEFMVNNYNHTEDVHWLKNSTVADDLAKKVRVLCWIMTYPANHQKKAVHVKATWGKRCNILLFMSSTYDESLPSIPLPVQEGRNNLWAKTKEALKYIYRNYYDDADWFLKADDDTYVIVENLRFMLMKHNSSDPIYFGCRFQPFAEPEYMSGGAGVILSKKTLALFIEKGLPDPEACRQDNAGSEDVELGICLTNIGAKPMDDRDGKYRKRFFPFLVEDHLTLNPKYPSWYLNYAYYRDKPGFNCCSETAISFHYVEPDRMYVYEYLLYRLRPYGINYNYNIDLSNFSNDINSEIDLIN